MKKIMTVMLTIAMIFNSAIGIVGYAETETNETNNIEMLDENIITETGTVTVGSETNPWWMADDKTSADVNAREYIAGSSNTTGYTKISTEFCGYVFKRNQTESYVILRDPDGAYLTELSFYMYYRRMPDGEFCDISVSDTLNGPFTSVSSEKITTENVGKNGNDNTKKVWKNSITGIKAKYVKITGPTSNTETGGLYPVLGAFTYNWLKITDLSQLPDGTNKICGTSNPYWLADSPDDVLKPFVEYTVAATYATASSTVTAEDITASNGAIAGNPINSGERSFIGVRGNGAYAIIEAPDNTFIRRFKFHAYNVGGEDGFNFSLAVSNELDGTYTPVATTKKKLGYLSGMQTNHFIYAIETAELINCQYVKITFPSAGYPKLGSFEYDYKINKVGVELDKIFNTYDDILGGQDRMHVESNLNFFENIDMDGKLYTIDWISSDPERVKPDGTVNQLAESKTISVKAKVKDETGAEVYSKKYELIIAALGSTLVVREDFEEAELNETSGIGAVGGYNGWTSTNKPETQSGIIKDPVDASNKALWVHRELKGQSGDGIQKDYEEISSGKVEITFKHMISQSGTEFRLRFAGLDLYVRPGGVWGYGSDGARLSLSPQDQVIWKLGVWHEYKFVLDADKCLLYMYFDGDLILDGAALPKMTYKATSVSFATKNDKIGSSYFDDICVRDISPEISSAVEFDAQLLKLPESTTNDLELIRTGAFDTMIAWQSSDPDVISNNGTVTQQAEDTDVTLHATLVKGESMTERDFVIKVLGSENAGTLSRDEATLEKIADRFSLSKVLDGQSALNITDNIDLPTEYNAGDAGRLGGCNIVWTGGIDGVLTNDGVVTRGETDKKVTLTAEFSFKEQRDVKTQRTYMFIVSGEGEYAYMNGMDAIPGENASVIEGVDAPVIADSNVFYGACQAPDDMLNSVMGVSRSTKATTDSKAVIGTDFTGKCAEVGISFRLTSANDRLDINFNGIDIPVYVTRTAISVNGNSYAATVNTNEWHKFTICFEDYNKFYTAYLDGEALFDGNLTYGKELSIDSITVSNEKADGSIGIWYVDDVYIKNTNVTDEEAIRRTLETISIADVAEWNIELPTFGKFGTIISWSSEDDSVLDKKGVVTRKVGDDKTITLTASVSRGGVVSEKEFDILVPGLRGDETPTQEKFTEHVNAIDISELTDEKYTEITDDLDLFNEYMTGNCAFYGGMDVEWSSEFSKIITDDGRVNRPLFDKGVTLTATFTAKRDTNITAQKEFNFIVHAKGERIYYEDFEDISEDMVGQSIHEYKTWKLEQQIAATKGMKADLAIDPADSGKPFSEANKAFRINRYRVATGTEVLPERARWYSTPEQKKAILEADAVVFSFNIKFINPTSRLDYIFGGVQGQIHRNKIVGTVSGTYKNGALTTDEWHTMTFIICPTSGVVYFLIDGKIATPLPYYTYDARLDVDLIEMHTFRKGGFSDFYIDDISIRVLDDDDFEAVANSKETLTIEENPSDKVTLPSFALNRTNVTWTSDDHSVVLDNGKIVGTGSALLTAIIKRGTETTTKEFSVNAIKTNHEDFAVNNLVISDGIISGANISYQGVSTDAELIVLVYNKDRLVQMRNSSITGTDITFDSIDTTEMYDCIVKAYVKKASDIVSNVLVIDLQ